MSMLDIRAVKSTVIGRPVLVGLGLEKRNGIVELNVDVPETANAIALDHVHETANVGALVPAHVDALAHAIVKIAKSVVVTAGSRVVTNGIRLGLRTSRKTMGNTTEKRLTIMEVTTLKSRLSKKKIANPSPPMAMGTK